jgi:N-acetylglucosaminyldiphosphoundecaprenol N-acetyl-beta-D-mannosaminyltransferase
MGVPVDDVTIDEAVERIAAMVETGRATGRTHRVATVNVDFVVHAARDPSVLDVLQRTDLSIPDGMPVVWASRLLGTPIRERTSGVDLLPALVRRGVPAGHRIVLLGGKPGVADAAAALLNEQHPGADVRAVGAPDVASDGAMDETWIERIRDARADVLGVALGHPKQERWIARYGAAVGAPVAIGIGGTLDFLTGETTRAPQWMRAAGLEWLHRALSEPRRLAGRYAGDFVSFGPGLARQLWIGRRRGAAVFPAVVERPDGLTLHLRGPLPVAHLDPAVETALDRHQPVTVDLDAVDRLDNVTVSQLVLLSRRAAPEAPVQVRGASPGLLTRARRLAVDRLLGAAN